jgi:hypothetical protein
VTEQGRGACYRCNSGLDIRGAVGRRDECPSCGAEVRCCRNCAHFDAAYHNQCREPQAERQVEKERANFCEYFRLASPGRRQVERPSAAARRDLDALFRRRE